MTNILGDMRTLWRTVAVVASMLASGCAVLRSGVTTALSSGAAELAASIQQESDLELVREGAPAYLLLLNSLANRPTASREVLLAAAEANTAYAMAFLDVEAPSRAKELHGRALEYGLRVLRRNREFRAAEHGSAERFEAAVRSFRRKDVPALFVTGTAWLNYILAQRDSPAALAQLSSAMALMRRVLELDPNYRRGAAHLPFAIYYVVQPPGAGRNLDKAREHFEALFRIAGPNYLPAQVAFAEYYARYRLDRELFEETLKRVLNPQEDPPEYRLMNAISRVRAQKLLERVEEWF